VFIAYLVLFVSCYKGSYRPPEGGP